MELNEKIAARRKELAAEAEKAKNAEKARDAKRRKELAIENEKNMQKQREEDARCLAANRVVEPVSEQKTRVPVDKEAFNNYSNGFFKSSERRVFAIFFKTIVALCFISFVIHQYTKQNPLTSKILNKSGWTLVYQNESIGNAYADYTSIKKTASGSYMFEMAYNFYTQPDTITNDKYEVNCTNMDLRYLGSELSIEGDVHKNSASGAGQYPIDLIDNVANDVCRKATGKQTAKYSNRSANIR